MPPRREKSGISLTVNTSDLSSVVSVPDNCLSSDELMNTMRQSNASAGLVIRLVTRCFPFMLASDRARSKIAPKGSCPRTQIGKESLLSEAILGGHPTNRPKLYKYAAFT